ncbi:Cullinlike [Caligus rogercresseyi]|uniref:Cullin-2 n=1 Tax=Caligus rogercresseyi TaxID=217165 RepID=A0A7T8KJD7_CALRO|nr:Cullinlike [Caligus rogercresseyi]
MSDAELTYGSLSINPSEQMKEIGELGLDIWRRKMIEPVQDELVRLLLDGIHYDRLNENGSTGQIKFQSGAVIKGVINSFVSVEEFKKRGNLELYETIFEKPFLVATGEFYKNEASKLLQEGSIESESKRCIKFVYPTSYNKVTSECEQRMVGDHIELLHSECKPMVERELKDDLNNMYRLLKSISGAQDVLLEEIQNHIKNQGLKAISNLKGHSIAKDFVENVLEVYHKYRELIFTVFYGDQPYIGTLDKACTAIINHRQSKQMPKSPELKSQKGISENEIDDKLNASITVFKYLDDKDVFQKFYARNLGKRLIYQQSHSMDLEEGMINRLKQACGYEFTNKFHRMFTDISLAEDLNNNQNGLCPLAIPIELEKTVQMYKELLEATKMSEEQFPRNLQSLLDAKLLECDTGEINVNSVITLNMGYSNKRTKFRITRTLQNETPQEVEHTHQAVEEDRKMYLQATIVRTMKSRKVLKHNLLIQEVKKEEDTLNMIKKCIESLIDKAYIERTANGNDEYSYMA